jgi:hypothetical protein
VFLPGCRRVAPPLHSRRWTLGRQEDGGRWDAVTGREVVVVVVVVVVVSFGTHSLAASGRRRPGLGGKYVRVGVLHAHRYISHALSSIAVHRAILRLRPHPRHEVWRRPPAPLAHHTTHHHHLDGHGWALPTYLWDRLRPRCWMRPYARAGLEPNGVRRECCGPLTLERANVSVEEGVGSQCLEAVSGWCFMQMGCRDGDGE